MQEIEKIDKTNLANTLTALDKIARDFFMEAFMIKRNADYSSLENLFKQKGNEDVAKFCMMMNNALYSGKKTSKANNEKLILILEGIIKNNPLFTDEELERMKEEKTGMLDRLKNVGIPGVGKKEVNNKQDNSKQN